MSEYPEEKHESGLIRFIEKIFDKLQEREEREMNKHIRRLDLQIHGTVNHIIEDRRSHPILIFSFFDNHIKIKGEFIMLELFANEFVLGVLSLIDSVTKSAIAASFAGQQFTGDNDAAFTVTPDSSDTSGSTVRVTGVAEGSGNMTAEADATYQDANTGQQVTKHLAVVIPVTIKKVVSAEGVELTVNFGTPQPQAATQRAR